MVVLLKTALFQAQLSLNKKLKEGIYKVKTLRKGFLQNHRLPFVYP